MGPADQCCVGRFACQLGQSDCVIEAPHPAAGEKAGDGELARLPSDLMAVLKLDAGPIAAQEAFDVAARDSDYLIGSVVTR